MTYIPIRDGYVATLACGLPAYTRGTPFITQTMINVHGSYAAARAALEKEEIDGRK